MTAEKEYGVIEKVKSLVSGGGGKLRVPVSGLNLPWLLARCDCAFRELLPLLRSSTDVREGNLCEYYAMLLGMVNDILDSLSVIYRETRKSSKVQKIEPDPGVPVLKIIADSLQVLHESAVLSLELQEQKSAAESFAGTGILSKFNGIEDSVSNMEVEMLHNISELVESIVPAMQKNSEQRKKSLSKNGADCYVRAEKELALYYSSFSGKINDKGEHE